MDKSIVYGFLAHPVYRYVIL